MLRRRILLSIVVLVLLGGSAYLYWPSTTETAIHRDIPGVEYGYSKPSSSTPVIKEKKTQISQLPDLNRSVVIPKDFSSADASAVTKKIREIVDFLKKSSQNSVVWESLGLERKGIEDYEGARQAWEYALVLDPYNAVTTDNLGVLYEYYLKDARKAEDYFLAAIKLEPLEVTRYQRAFEFYHDVLHNDKKARQIIEEGTQRVPNNADLRALLGE